MKCYVFLRRQTFYNDGVKHDQTTNERVSKYLPTITITQNMIELLGCRFSLWGTDISPKCDVIKGRCF